MTRLFVAAAAILLVLSLLQVPLYAQGVPPVLNYSGRLAVDGSSATGSYQITFAIYSAPDGGNALWSESHAVTVVEGTFSVLLGNDVPLSPIVLEADSERYLGIQVEDEPEMRPRLLLASSAYALRAAMADAVGAQSIGSAALIGGAVTATHLADGAVGEAKLANTSVSEVKLADASVTQAKLADASVTQAKLAPGVAVTSLNGQSGDVSLAAGSNVSILETSGTITISSSGGGSGGGDITAVMAGEGLSGGGTVGDVTLSLANASVTGTKLTDGSVTESKLADASVTQAKLGAASVTESKLADAAVTETKLANASVSRAKLSDGAVSTSKLAPGAAVTRLNGQVGAVSLAAGNNVSISEESGTITISSEGSLVGGGDITAIVAGEGLSGGGTTGDVTLSLADASVTDTKLADASVSEAKLADASVTQAKLAAASVTASRLADASVTGVKLAPGAAVTSLNGQAGAVSLAAGSNVVITEDAGTITISSEGESSDGDITAVVAGEGLSGGGTVGDVTLSLADASVTEAKLGDAAVNTAKLADASVTETKLVDASVTGTKLADASVTQAKLTPGVAVTSLNALAGDVTLQGGRRIDVTQSGNTITIAYTSNNDGELTNSSRRWKTNIRTIDNSLDLVQQLRGVRFEWKEDERADIGLIAEEVGQVVPEIVLYEANGRDAKAVNYSRLVALLVEAVKMQQQQIEMQQQQLEAQQGATGDLSARVNRLEQLITEQAGRQLTAPADSTEAQQ